MPVPSTFADLSTTPASNSPAGSEAPTDGDNYIRTLAAFLKSISSNTGNGWTTPYLALAGGTMTGNLVLGAVDLTVDTNTFKVDAANNRVIVGHTSGAVPFTVSNAGASGLEVDPTGGASAGPLFQAYDRSGAAYKVMSYYALSHKFQVGAAGATAALDLDSSGNVIAKVNGTAPTLTVNSTMSFELTSNTNLKIFVRGTDGTTRSVSLTLA
jgi:hypothetical protein